MLHENGTANRYQQLQQIIARADQRKKFDTIMPSYKEPPAKRQLKLCCLNSNLSPTSKGWLDTCVREVMEMQMECKARLTRRGLLHAAVHADHGSDIRCFQPVILSLVMAVPTHM